MTRTKTYKTIENVLDNGEWLRPFLSPAAVEARFVPDDETVARIRRQLLDLISEEYVTLVA